MSTSDSSAFDDATVAAIGRRFALLADHERPILWQHATLPHFEPLRAWLHQELAGLDAQVAHGFRLVMGRFLFICGSGQLAMRAGPRKTSVVCQLR